VSVTTANVTTANITNAVIGTANVTTANVGTLTLTNALGTASGGTGLTSFTSGGVVYASSGSALTTGSALTWDGSTFYVKPTGAQFVTGATFAKIENLSGASASFIMADTTDSATIKNIASSLAFINSGTEGMRLTSTGLGIGLGGSSPGNRLHVQGSGDVARFTNGSNSAYFALDSSGFTLFTGAGQTGNGLYAKASDNSLQLWTNSSAKVYLDSSGNLLVGQTGQGPANSYSMCYGVGNTGGLDLSHISGSASGTMYARFNYNATTIGSITQSGTAAVLYNVTSDQRLKENIQDADSASSLIDSLQVRKFDWKTDNTHQRYGFVAQEIVSVAPEAVHQPADPDEMMAVDYSKLVPMLVKEIQSLRIRIAQLEAK